MKSLVSIGLLSMMPLLAHHSIFAEYDTSKIVTLKGTVTKVEFMNPHVQLYLDVEEPDGNMTHWVVETLPPNTLKRLGASKDSFKQGDQVSVDAWAAKDGSKSANALTLNWSDGRTMNVGDRSTTTKFTGTVTRVEWPVEWMDQRAHLYLDVVEADGKVTNWAFEMSNPATLMRTGFNKDSLKQGDQVSVDALFAKNGNKSASAKILSWPDGHSVVVADGWTMSR
jgi:hypothetical protein